MYQSKMTFINLSNLCNLNYQHFIIQSDCLYRERRFQATFEFFIKFFQLMNLYIILNAKDSQLI